MQPKISIAIATYNGERFISEQLDSLCRQTMQPYEVVVSDDGSTDRTLDIVRDYQDRLNLKIVQHDSNKGVNKNFETAMMSCTGDYVMPCDQDDIWMNKKIQRSCEIILSEEEKHGKDMPILITVECTSFHNEVPNVQDEGDSHGMINDPLSFLFTYNLHCQGCSMMLNKPLLAELKNFPVNFADFPYDVYICMLATLTGKRCHLNQSLMFYRKHENNVVARYEKIGKMEVAKNWLQILTYTLFDIPYSRQLHYAELINDEKIAIKDINIEKNVISIGRYPKETLLGRIRIINSITGIPLMERIRQLSAALITTPFRFFIRPV